MDTIKLCAERQKSNKLNFAPSSNWSRSECFHCCKRSIYKQSQRAAEKKSRFYCFARSHCDTIVDGIRVALQYNTCWQPIFAPESIEFSVPSSKYSTSSRHDVFPNPHKKMQHLHQSDKLNATKMILGRDNICHSVRLSPNVSHVIRFIVISLELEAILWSHQSV